MKEQNNVSGDASKKKQLRITSIILIVLILTLFLLSSQPINHISLQTISKPDSTKNSYGLFSIIPNEEHNIFKGKKLTEIYRLRNSYLLGLADSTKEFLFEFEEIDEVCRQAFI